MMDLVLKRAFAPVAAAATIFTCSVQEAEAANVILNISGVDNTYSTVTTLTTELNPNTLSIFSTATAAGYNNTSVGGTIVIGTSVFTVGNINAFVVIDATDSITLTISDFNLVASSGDSDSDAAFTGEYIYTGDSSILSDASFTGALEAIGNGAFGLPTARFGRTATPETIVTNLTVSSSSLTSVPEPSSVLMFGATALAGLSVRRRPAPEPV